MSKRINTASGKRWKDLSGARKTVIVCMYLAYFFMLLLLFAVKDFIVTAASDGDNYEVRLVQEETLSNGQEVWRLYKNGEDYGDIDINEYSLLDENGNTDYKYCKLIQDAKGLAYSVILCAMIVIVILIANTSADGTPFVRKNVRRIYALGALQFALAIVPGLTVFLMKFFKFLYTSLHMGVGSIYMFLIAIVIMMLAGVFARGVELQEDSDSIA